MPHEIETLAYFGRLPWHGLGTAWRGPKQTQPEQVAQAGQV
jgi:hypothetical protein